MTAFANSRTLARRVRSSGIVSIFRRAPPRADDQAGIWRLADGVGGDLSETRSPAGHDDGFHGYSLSGFGRSSNYSPAREGEPKSRAAASTLIMAMVKRKTVSMPSLMSAALQGPPFVGNSTAPADVHLAQEGSSPC